MARIHSFLGLVVDQKASDLHFHSGCPPIIRYLGDLIPIPFRELGEEETKKFIFEIMTDEQRAVFDEKQSVDFAYEVPAMARFRVNVFQQSRGMGAVFRIIPDSLPSLDQLRLPPSVHELARMPNGIVLVTGPTGSGKSTTMAAIVDEINRNNQCNIITIEDPIEYIHHPKQSLITQRELGKHTKSTLMALRAALREAPDVVVVGELRDYETISLALSAAETGTLVFATMHTNSASKAIDRVLSAVPDDALSQVSSTMAVLLRGVVAQRLCKLMSGDGRIAVCEVLLQNYAVANLIRESKTYQIDGYLQSGEHSGSGMTTMERSIFQYMKEGLIDEREGLKSANDPQFLKQLIAKHKESGRI